MVTIAQCQISAYPAKEVRWVKMEWNVQFLALRNVALRKYLVEEAQTTMAALHPSGACQQRDLLVTMAWNALQLPAL